MATLLADRGIDVPEHELAAIEAGQRQPLPHLIAGLARVLNVTVPDLTG